MSIIESVRCSDVRFPTSLELDGSDAVNVDPDYSAAYVEITTDKGESGYGMVFTCGRGNELVTAGMETYGELLLGRDTDDLVNNLGDSARRLVHDSQLRWLGPEKGVSHMACGGLINALWDLRARREGKPLWLLLSEMSADELVSTVDFTHIRNALTPEDAADILTRGQAGKAARIAELKEHGYPAYTTTPGWLGYSDEKLVRLSKEAVESGFGMIKLKVAGSIEDDRRRLALARQAVGPDIRIAIDANQRWEEQEAIDWINQLQEFEPYWIEEPTSTDDILAHGAIRRAVSPVKVATGEAVQNRIIFKQMLQAGSIDILQIDATRVAGVNENIANLLLAARFDTPVCPHAGGVGLCELVQHFSFFDYAAVSTSMDDRVIEYVDHLHEHFAEPVVVANGRYRAPSLPGVGAQILAGSASAWTYPSGSGWQDLSRRPAMEGSSR